MTVELRHLRAFLAIVDEGNISRAAARLHLSQPALSRTLVQLELFLGVQLVDRSTHHSHVTPAGHAFSTSARAAVQAFDAALDIAIGTAPPVRFGQSWSSAIHAAAIVRAWNAEHPDQPVALRRSDDRLAGLSAGHVDIALVRAVVVDRSLASAVIDDETRVAAVPATHPLAHRRQLKLADLVDERLVINSVTGTTTLDLWPLSARPVIGSDSETIEDWLMAIATGVGIGVTPASTATLHPRPDIRYIPIVDAPTVPLVLMWPKRGSHPQTKSFVATARRATRHLRS
jgi:DNA-binding transcriptional LysR family regulator